MAGVMSPKILAKIQEILDLSKKYQTEAMEHERAGTGAVVLATVLNNRKPEDMSLAISELEAAMADAQVSILCFLVSLELLKIARDFVQPKRASL